MLKLRQFTTTTTRFIVINRNLLPVAAAPQHPLLDVPPEPRCRFNLLIRRSVSSTTSLSPAKVTEILSANEHHLDIKGSSLLPRCIKSVECNQLASNNPIEDRLRIASIQLPGTKEPTLVFGVFDGHGGGTTVDVISRRLFNYIAVSLHPEPSKIDVANGLDELVVDLHNMPPKFNVDPHTREIELQRLSSYRDELTQNGRATHRSDNIVSTLKASFQRCDDDLSQEVQEHLIRPTSLSYQMLRHYLSAAVSGCCAIVTVIHQGSAYVVSVGDCRAVLGVHGNKNKTDAQDGKIQVEGTSHTSVLQSVELNDEHNCDNINEIRRLAAAHPKSEQNTMIKHNRLLGHLMPFRAFGDFNYKWSSDMIKACGITRTFGAGVIPAHYETPPYLIVEPDVSVVHLDSQNQTGATGAGEVSSIDQSRFLVMATDGLWELFESSRDVVETIVDHMNNASQEENKDYYDTNCATYVMRSALCAGPYPDISSDAERMRKLHHIRLETTLTLPKSVVRNFRDDISIILIQLQ